MKVITWKVLGFNVEGFGFKCKMCSFNVKSFMFWQRVINMISLMLYLDSYASHFFRMAARSFQNYQLHTGLSSLCKMLHRILQRTVVLWGDLTHPCEDSSLGLDFFSFLELVGTTWGTVQLSSHQFASGSEPRKAPRLPTRTHTHIKQVKQTGNINQMPHTD